MDALTVLGFVELALTVAALAVAVTLHVKTRPGKDIR